MVSCSSHLKFQWHFRFVVGMIMVKKWLSINNTITTINTSVRKVTKQLAGAESILNTITGGETASLHDCQKECMIKIGITWHGIMISIIYKAIILAIMGFICKTG